MRTSVFLYLSADAASVLGNSFIGIVLPWLVLTRTGDPAAAGVVAAASALPAVLAALVGGWLVDRAGRRRMSIISDLGSATAVAAIPLVDMVFGLNTSWFVALAVLGALFDVPGMTARESLLADVGRASGMSMDRLAGIREGVFGISMLAGPALAGIALSVFDAGSVVVGTAVTSAIAALCIRLLPREIEGERPSEGEAPPIRSLFSGVIVLRRDPVLIALTVLSVGSVGVIAPLQALLLPSWYAQLQTPGLLGITVSALALGTFVGAALYAAVAGRLKRRTAYLLCLLIITLGMALLTTLWSPTTVIVAMFVCGFGSGLLSPIIPVVLSERVPAAQRGRVFGVQNAVIMTMTPLAIGAATVAASVSLSVAFLAAGAVWLALAVYGVLTPGMRRLDSPTGAPARERAR
ncbi:MFS transporter [Rhodococcus pyridinivorans]|uniref:MFS transporter n=1 Tax=Rhodococcus pyridinivorans TaxID=103816 RepID=UPI00207850F4|nr:MFS transporter [Rhodococcus pyridinivorans]USI88391.1 MFS transporter [Rhodococcus pyridinivorans]